MNRRARMMKRAENDIRRVQQQIAIRRAQQRHVEAIVAADTRLHRDLMRITRPARR
jgi:hypothetical protein